MWLTYQLSIAAGLTDRFKALQVKQAAPAAAGRHHPAAPTPSSITTELLELENWLDKAERVLEANHDRTLEGIADLEKAIRSHRVSSVGQIAHHVLLTT